MKAIHGQLPPAPAIQCCAQPDGFARSHTRFSKEIHYMRLYARLVMTALIAATAFAAFATSASSRNLSTSNQNFRVVWSSLEFQPSFGSTIRCRLTLEGSFHAATIAKVEKTLMGYVTRAIVGHRCTNGEMWAFNGTEVLNGTTLTNTLPWHVTWGTFTGTLPRITSISILLERARFLIEQLGLRCNYTMGSTNGSPRGTMTRNTSTGVVDNLVASTGAITSETGGCPTIRFLSRGEDGLVTLLGAETRITVTLI